MKKRNSSKVVAVLGGIIFLISCLSFIVAEEDLTASISNPRMVLYGNYTGEEIVIENLVGVRNDNSYDVKITLSAIEDLKDKISFDETEFVLTPGESKDVDYLITLDDAGVYNGGVRVLFSIEGDNRELSLVQEVVVMIAGEKEGDNFLLIGLGALVLLLLGLGVYWRFKK